MASDEDELRKLTEDVRKARERLKRQIERSKTLNVSRRYGMAERLAHLRQVLRRSEAIRKQAEILRKRRKNVH